MVCLGLEPWAAGWMAQTNPLSYGGTPYCYLQLAYIKEKVASNGPFEKPFR